MVWALLLLLLAAFAWVNHKGLPEFLKTRLVAALRQRGVELEFTRMRLHYYHGLVCDNVRVGAADDAAGPVLTAREVQLRISYSALLHGHLQMDGLVLRQGKFTLPLTPQDSLLLTNLQGELRILPQDTWVLDHFRVDLAGVTFTLAGQIAHAPECRHWQLFGTAPAPAHAPGPGQASLKKFADTLKQIHFEGQPRLDARIDGDARDMHSFNLSVSARAPAIQTPWFNLRHFEFATHLLAPTNTLLQGGPAWNVWTNLEPFRLDWFARGTNFQSGSLQADARIAPASGARPGISIPSPSPSTPAPMACSRRGAVCAAWTWSPGWPPPPMSWPLTRPGVTGPIWPPSGWTGLPAAPTWNATGCRPTPWPAGATGTPPN